MKKTILSYIVFMLISCTGLIASDNTSSNTLESETDEIIINNIPLSFNIEIIESNSRFVYDLLDARVTIKNRDNNKHYLEYKFIWYDESGFETSKNQSKWKQVRVDAKDTIKLKALAVTSKIDSFKFYIRASQ